MANKLQGNEILIQPWRETVWFAIKFCLAFVALEWIYFSIPDAFLRDFIYHSVLVAPSAATINFLSPSEQVVGHKNLLMSAKSTLEIVRGCDGAGTIFLLSAAIVAFASPAKTKPIGLLGGIAALMFINYVRIIGLYFISAYANSWFTPTHSYIAPTLIILLGCVIFALWAHYAQPKQS